MVFDESGKDWLVNLCNLAGIIVHVSHHSSEKRILSISKGAGQCNWSDIFVIKFAYHIYMVMSEYKVW